LNDRKGLLEGKKVKSCNFCWDQENASGKLSSERVYKSASPWANEYFDEVIDAKSQKLINPSYLEVSFSNKCNLKCVYCNPQTSSSIYQEILKFGPYSDSQNTGDLEEIRKRFDFNQKESENPYVKEFISWFPDIINELEIIRFTGGEPLYSDGMFECLEILKNEQNSKIQIEINTNLSTPRAQILKLKESLAELNQVKKKTIITSVDTWGVQAEYIRSGLNLELFKSNLEYLLHSVSDLEIRITVTFNIFSAFNFEDLLKYVLELKRKYKKYDKILLSIYPLISPFHLSLKILDESAIGFLLNSYDFMVNHKISPDEPFGFNEYEVDSFEKIILFYEDTYPKNLKKDLQEDFYLYISDFDIRKKTSIVETFPNLNCFWNSCKSLSENRLNKALISQEPSKDLLNKLFRAYLNESLFPVIKKEQIKIKICEIIIVAKDEDKWKFIGLSKYSKNLKAVKEIATFVLNHIDLKFWGGIYEYFPLEVSNFSRENSCSEKIIESIKNDIALWEFQSFINKLPKLERSFLISRIETQLVNRALNHLKEEKESWDVIKIISMFSDEQKRNAYDILRTDLLKTKFAGMVFEYVEIFNQCIDEEFINTIFIRLNATRGKDLIKYGENLEILKRVKYKKVYINKLIKKEIIKEITLKNKSKVIDLKKLLGAF
jgi:organic radical activating enzyme